MKYILLFSTVLLAFSSAAQDCTPELLAKKAGTWKAGPQGSIHNVTATDLVKEKTVLATIHTMLSSNYKPTGCEVSYSTVFLKDQSTGTNWIADPYQFAIYILPYLCDSKSTDRSKYTVAIASATSVNISANMIASLNSLYAAAIPSDDFRGYLKLKQRPQLKDGNYFMGEEIIGDKGTTSEIKESRWLITYNDTLPFYYVSRKEYLLVQKKRLEKALIDNPGEKEYTNTFIKNINEYLKKPDTTLSQPAICRWNEEERFEKFVEEGSSGSFIAVKPNLNYYRKNLPKSTPQFFTVVYTISAGDGVFAENISNIKKAIDLRALKKILGNK